MPPHTLNFRLNTKKMGPSIFKDFFTTCEQSGEGCVNGNGLSVHGVVDDLGVEVAVEAARSSLAGLRFNLRL